MNPKSLEKSNREKRICVADASGAEIWLNRLDRLPRSGEDTKGRKNPIVAAAAPQIVSFSPKVKDATMDLPSWVTAAVASDAEGLSVRPTGAVTSLGTVLLRSRPQNSQKETAAAFS